MCKIDDEQNGGLRKKRKTYRDKTSIHIRNVEDATTTNSKMIARNSAWIRAYTVGCVRARVWVASDFWVGCWCCCALARLICGFTAVFRGCALLPGLILFSLAVSLCRLYVTIDQCVSFCTHTWWHFRIIRHTHTATIPDASNNCSTAASNTGNERINLRYNSIEVFHLHSWRWRCWQWERERGGAGDVPWPLLCVCAVKASQKSNTITSRHSYFIR